MRWLILLPLLGCATANVEESEVDSRTVRDRLGSEKTRLFIAPGTGTGTIAARRYTQTGWQDGAMPLAVENGELLASVDTRGALVLDKLEVRFGPIPLPDAVFGKPAQLVDAKVALAAPGAPASATWTSPDDATARPTLDLAVTWHIEVDAGKTAMSAQLTKVPLDVTLGRDDAIRASLALDARGTLWSLAGLFELTAIELDVEAATVESR